MIVEKEDELAERRELFRQRLRELGKASLEAAAPIEERRELPAELGGVAPQGADEIRKEDERILVAALEGEPCGVPARRAQEVGILRDDRRLAVARGCLDEGQAVPLRAGQPVEQALPPEKRKR